MSELVKCFWLTTTNLVEVSYRRYRGYPHKDKCEHSGMGYHNAEVILERGPESNYPTYNGDWGDKSPHADPRWPTQCKCGYVFQEEDEWQARTSDLYVRSDNGEYTTDEQVPAGAMRHEYWHKGKHWRLGADGIMLSVKLPNGSWWCVDGPACKDGEFLEGGWTRTGTVPDTVTAMPSIDAPGYHGWLQNGYLRRC